MVIDAAKGIESQTRKLFEVCRLRDIPIITFINKVDREGQDPLELLDEIAVEPGARRGADDLADRHGRRFPAAASTCVGKRMLLPERRAQQRLRACRASCDAPEDILAMPQHRRATSPTRALEGLELARSALPAFDLESFREGHLTPVFFGCALQQLRRAASCSTRSPQWAPAAAAAQGEPSARSSPTRSAVTGFVFKVQANMDPNHRDRIAFVRLCSGHFQRGMKLLHVRERQASSPSASPILFFAQRARDGRRSLRGRHHRHPQPRHAARRRHAHRGRDAQVHRHSELRARDPAPRA